MLFVYVAITQKKNFSTAANPLRTTQPPCFK